MLKGVEICLQSKDGRNFREQDTMYKTWRWGSVRKATVSFQSIAEPAKYIPWIKHTLPS
jgi:hypothetical protein